MRILTVLTAGTLLLAQDQLPTLKVDVDVVSVLASVRDKKGTLIPNLEKNDFTVLEDGKPQRVGAKGGVILPRSLDGEESFGQALNHGIVGRRSTGCFVMDERRPRGVQSDPGLGLRPDFSVQPADMKQRARFDGDDQSELLKGYCARAPHRQTMIVRKAGMTDYVRKQRERRRHVNGGSCNDQAALCHFRGSSRA